MILDSEAIAAFVLSEREAVVSVTPFVVRRAARWTECDPAGVVYTGHFTEYLLSAAHLFRRQVLGRSWASMRDDMGVDTPAKAMSMVFRGTLWPDDVFDTAVHVGAIRTRTFEFVARASRVDTGLPVFDGTITFICVSATDRGRSIGVPDPLRKRLEAHRNADPSPPADPTSA